MSKPLEYCGMCFGTGSWVEGEPCACTKRETMDWDEEAFEHFIMDTLEYARLHKKLPAWIAAEIIRYRKTEGLNPCAELPAPGLNPLSYVRRSAVLNVVKSIEVARQHLAIGNTVCIDIEGMTPEQEQEVHALLQEYASVAYRERGSTQLNIAPKDAK